MAIAVSIGGFESRILDWLSIVKPGIALFGWANPWKLLAVTSPVQVWHIVLLLKSWAVLVHLLRSIVFQPWHFCSYRPWTIWRSILHAAILLVPSEFRFSVDSITIFHWKIVFFPQTQIYTGWWLTYPSDKYESQIGSSSQLLGKIKHVPNHQPATGWCPPKT